MKWAKLASMLAGAVFMFLPCSAQANHGPHHHGGELHAQHGTPPSTGKNNESMHMRHAPEKMSNMGQRPAKQDPAPTPYEAPPPPVVYAAPQHAADMVYDPAEMAQARETLGRDQGGTTAYKVMFDRLESRFSEGEEMYLWDGQAWYGGDRNKFWFKTEGEGAFSGKLEDAEIQGLWSHAILPWWDLQAGVRQDFVPDGEERTHLVLGIQGLAPYFFEVDAATFISDKGEFTARIEAEYDQLITQKLILQPRVELNFSGEDIPELEIGSGLSTVDVGLRLRYEFVPEFAPYIGVSYQTKAGATADFARASGEDVNSWIGLAGLRTWF